MVLSATPPKHNSSKKQKCTQEMPFISLLLYNEQAMPGSAGLGLQLPHNEITLEPENHHSVRMGLAITVPQGYYGCVEPCNGLALQAAIHYTGSQLLQCAQVDQIAQLICEQIGVPTIQETDSLQPTQQPGGLGSTGHAVWVHGLTKPEQSEGDNHC
uniref:dUTP diphosphatase n=1 Tax=Dromaius novaehollandiae TaxID=8790 RepID=A0A8C4KUJ6_DRONO